MIWNVMDYVGAKDAYYMGQWAKNIDHWSATQGHTHTTGYGRGDILMADFGAMNYGYEFGYDHPCVVLVARTHMLLVVPGSSKKFNNGRPEYLDATSANDGFNRNTGLLLENMRWIHKNRVIRHTGRQTSQRVLDEIEKYILKDNQTYKNMLRAKNQDITSLRAQDFAQKNTIQQLNQNAASLQGQIQQLQSENTQLVQENKLQVNLIKEQYSSILKVLRDQGYDNVLDEAIKHAGGLEQVSNE